MLVIQGDIFLDAGDGNIMVDPSKLTRRKSEDLNAKMVKARIANSDFGKLPPNDGESKDDYEVRFKKWAEEQDESNKELTARELIEKKFEYRVFQNNMDYLFACVRAVASIVGQEHKINDDKLSDTPLYLINNFVVKVCKIAKVPCEFEEILVDLQ